MNGARLWVEDFLLGAPERFHAVFATLPQLEEPLNPQIKGYCDGLSQFVRGHEDWGSEYERCFGNKGLEIQQTRWMLLFPKKYTTEIGADHLPLVTKHCWRLNHVRSRSSIFSLQTQRQKS